MSTLPPTGEAPLSRRVDEVCDRFEAAWKAAKSAGARPRIEEYLGEVPGPQRPALLRELIPLEADYRRRAGERPRPEDFLTRFPELDAAWLSAALNAGATPAMQQVDATAAWVPTQLTTPPQGHGEGGSQPAPPTVGGYRILRPRPLAVKPAIVRLQGNKLAQQRGALCLGDLRQVFLDARAGVRAGRGLPGGLEAVAHLVHEP